MKDGYTIHLPDGLIVKKPELPYFPFFRNKRYNFIDVNIWGEIYRAEK